MQLNSKDNHSIDATFSFGPGLPSVAEIKASQIFDPQLPHSSFVVFLSVYENVNIFSLIR